MYCKGIEYNRSFYMGLTLSKGQKLEWSKLTANNIYMYYENLVNTLCSKVMVVISINHVLSMCILQSLFYGYIL